MYAFVFPGQGSQKVGMGKELVSDFPEAKDVFDQADAALGFSLSKLCFEGPDEDLKLTANSQPAILTMSIAVLRAIEKHTGLRPSMVAGHSLGEYSALVCAGALSFEDAVRTVNKRGQFMQDAVPVGEGSMAAVLAMAPDAVATLCKDAAQDQILVPANFNSPKQIAIAGHTAAVDRAVKLASERGGIAKKLPVSAPFHCPLMEPAAVKLGDELKKLTWNKPTVPVITNVEAAPNTDETRIADLLIKQVTGSVRWIECVERMVKEGAKEFIEIGLGKTLCGLIKQIDKSLVTSNIGGKEEITAAQAKAPADSDTSGSGAGDEEFDDGRKVMPDGKIIWPDGMVWDPNEPGAFGF